MDPVFEMKRVWDTAGYEHMVNSAYACSEEAVISECMIVFYE